MFFRQTGAFVPNVRIKRTVLFDIKYLHITEDYSPKIPNASLKRKLNLIFKTIILSLHYKVNLCQCSHHFIFDILCKSQVCLYRFILDMSLVCTSSKN